MVASVSVEALRPGVKIINNVEETDREKPLKKGEILELIGRVSFTYNRTTLQVGPSNDGNCVEVAYTAPMDDSLGPTGYAAPEATVYYRFGYQPGETSLEFGKARAIIEQGQAMIRATYLGHELREVVTPLLNSNLPADPIEYHRPDQTSSRFIVPVGPILTSDNLYGIRDRGNQDGFPGRARFYVDLGLDRRDLVAQLAIGFVTVDDAYGLTRIKKREIVYGYSGNYTESGNIIRMSTKYASRIAEFGAFLGILAENPSYYPNFSERGLNLRLLDLFVQPDVLDKLEWTKPFYKRDQDASSFMRYAGINWEQVLKDLPDISAEVQRLDDLIHNPKFSKTGKVPV